ncbi:hypothetical protein BP6252_09971 [Coleophoma cylindrospora]|uniref:NDT80 domain-containing protein n=1 Tax=Coleophoma cylindrospora TaxID=1849047 RepID=A0A3D8QX19_9HELO|nr:hypothetical protein BP6252_09971 [Coleophoma cylindrospora]
MADYKTMTMAAPNDVLRLSASEPSSHTIMSIGMDAFDHDLSFDGDSLLDDVQNHGLPSLPFTPSYELSDAFSTTFEDPFSYQSTPFESLVDDQSNADNGDANQNDPDNKMLGFGAPIMKAPVLDETGQTWPSMSAELYGMFFVAEDVFGGENAGRPMELTCYRRNLFQISGTVILSRTISHMLNEQGQQVPLYDLQATISALESIEGKATEIISVPWKTSAIASSEDKAGAAPPKWPLDLSISPELDPSCVSIPIAWKRLQFKHATANNGRRKGLQQHYVIQINLMATSAAGESVKLAEIQSGPIIVRGRSPRNFDSRKDVPLNERKIESKSRTTNDTCSTPAKVDSHQAYRYYAQNGLNNPGIQQMPLELPDWTSSTSVAADTPRPTKKHVISSYAAPRPPVPKTKWKNEPLDTKAVRTTAPIDLSLADEDSSRAKAGSIRHGPPASPQLSRKIVSSPVESADLLYEYFPMSLDDW